MLKVYIPFNAQQEELINQLQEQHFQQYMNQVYQQQLHNQQLQLQQQANNNTPGSPNNTPTLNSYSYAEEDKLSQGRIVENGERANGEGRYPKNSKNTNT